MRALRPGDTLVIESGVYREALIFPDADWSSGARTVIRAAPGAQVIIKGSDVVTDWERVREELYAKRRWRVQPEQVFVDGVALKQIGGTIFDGYPDKAGHPMRGLHAGQKGIWPGRVAGGVPEMSAGSFHFDAATETLYVKGAFGAMHGRLVEVSTRPFLVRGRGLRDVTLERLRFQHANTTLVAQSGAIRMEGDGLVLDRIEVTQVDGAGMDLTGDGIVVRDSRASHNGQVGMKVRGRGNRLVGNETSFNNTRGFNKWWEAGGAKFVGDGGLRDSEVTGHRAIGNEGDGIWFDWMNDNNRIHGNMAAYNSGFGIQYEASRRAYIHDNYVFGNRQRGIYLPDSADSIVAHNLVAGNGLQGVAIVDEGRGRQRREMVPAGNRIVANIIAWNASASVVLPEGVASVSDCNLFVSGAEGLPAFSEGWGSRERPVRKGLGAWRAASGHDLQSEAEARDVPETIAAALKARKVDVDWAPLLALADRHAACQAVPDLPGRHAGKVPGPAR